MWQVLLHTHACVHTYTRAHVHMHAHLERDERHHEYGCQVHPQQARAGPYVGHAEAVEVAEDVAVVDHSLANVICNKASRMRGGGRAVHLLLTPRVAVLTGTWHVCKRVQLNSHLTCLQRVGQSGCYGRHCLTPAVWGQGYSLSAASLGRPALTKGRSIQVFSARNLHRLPCPAHSSAQTAHMVVRSASDPWVVRRHLSSLITSATTTYRHVDGQDDSEAPHGEV